MRPSVRAPAVAGLILAAGASSRMPGPNKLSRAWCGGTLIEASVGTAIEAGLGPCVVVLGSDAEILLPSLRSHPVVPVKHSTWSRGRASSLAAGLRFLAGFDEVAAVVVLLADEPGVSPRAIRVVIDRWNQGSADLVRVRYHDRPGHPVLLGPAARKRAQTLSDDESVWKQLTASGLEGVEAALGLPAPIDVDVPSALAEARARQAAGSSGAGTAGSPV